MAVIEKFLGRRVEIPEDRHYYPQQGLWVKKENQEAAFGLTEPFLVMAGGFNGIDWIVPDGHNVKSGEAVIFAITGKILYIDSPINGAVVFNADIKSDPASVENAPYDAGWLFKVRPDTDFDTAVASACNFKQYLIALEGSEGFKNPDGLKGGVSGICKAVYSSIKEQRFETQ